MARTSKPTRREAVRIAAEQLAAGESISEAARLAGVDRSSVHRWLAQDEFNVEVRRQAELLERAAAPRLCVIHDRLTRAGIKAAVVVEQLLSTPAGKVKPKIMQARLCVAVAALNAVRAWQADLIAREIQREERAKERTEQQALAGRDTVRIGDRLHVLKQPGEPGWSLVDWIHSKARKEECLRTHQTRALQYETRAREFRAAGNLDAAQSDELQAAVERETVAVLTRDLGREVPADATPAAKAAPTPAAPAWQPLKEPGQP